MDCRSLVFLAGYSLCRRTVRQAWPGENDLHETRSNITIVVDTGHEQVKLDGGLLCSTGEDDMSTHFDKALNVDERHIQR